MACDETVDHDHDVSLSYTIQCECDVSDNSIDLTSLAFCEIVGNDCVEQIACDSVKVKNQGLLVDHSYVAVCHLYNVNKKKKRRIKKKSVKYTFPCVEDQQYVASNSHIFGSCDAVDTMLLIGQEFAAWCKNNKTAVTDYNKMECNTELMLKNALES